MLKQTMQSVLEQHYPDLEYIIIDGGSTDGTVDLIKQYAARVETGEYGNVKFQWLSEKDNGMYAAIMKGMSLATGKIVTWLNSDDMYHPDALRIVGQIFAQLPKVAWLTGTPTLYNAEGLCVKTFPTQYWSWKRFKRGDFRWLQQESTFFHKSLFDAVGGLNLEYKLAADFELWCKMFQHAKIYSVNTILGGFRQHGDQLSITCNEKYEKEVADICKFYNMQYKVFSKHFNYLHNILDKNNLIIFDYDNNQWMVL